MFNSCKLKISLILNNYNNKAEALSYQTPNPTVNYPAMG